MGMMDWAKFTKIIVNAEKEFEDKYNFELPPEDRTKEKLGLLAYGIYFETLRTNKILANQFEEITSALRDNSPFRKYFLAPTLEDTMFDYWMAVYQDFIYSRARGNSIDDAVNEAFDKNIDLLNEIFEKQLKQEEMVISYLRQNEENFAKQFDHGFTEEEKLKLESVGYKFLSNDIVRKNGTFDDYKVENRNDGIFFLQNNKVVDSMTILKSEFENIKSEEIVSEIQKKYDEEYRERMNKHNREAPIGSLVFSIFFLAMLITIVIAIVT